MSVWGIGVCVDSDGSMSVRVCLRMHICVRQCECLSCLLI